MKKRSKIDPLLTVKFFLYIHIFALVLSSVFWSLFSIVNLLLFTNILLISYLLKEFSLVDRHIKDISPELKLNNLVHLLTNQKNTFAQCQHVIQNLKTIGEESFVKVVEDKFAGNEKDQLLMANQRVTALIINEKNNKWIADGISSIGDIIYDSPDVKIYAEKVISHLVKCLEMVQGGFYVLINEEGDEFFQLKGSYAYNRKKFQESKVDLGDGLLGQMYFDKKMLILNEVPEGYMNITSGLGESFPRFLCIVPLIFEEKIYGAIELASFDELLPHEIEFLKKASEKIAFDVASLQNNARTQKLLQESQAMADELTTQKETLRQNMEELTAAQERMKIKQNEIDSVLSTLSSVELDLEGSITNANQVFLGITGYQEEEIVGKTYKGLIPESKNDQLQYEIMWESILSGKTFSGEFRITNKQKELIWMRGNFTPILNEENQPYKVMVVSQFTTQEKEKLVELQELVKGLKNCFPIVEINPDVSLKTANHIFLNQFGIKRFDLSKTSPEQLFSKNSLIELKACLSDIEADDVKELEVDFLNQTGKTQKYASALIKLKNNKVKGVLILKEMINERNARWEETLISK